MELLTAGLNFTLIGYLQQMMLLSHPNWIVSVVMTNVIKNKYPKCTRCNIQCSVSECQGLFYFIYSIEIDIGEILHIFHNFNKKLLTKIIIKGVFSKFNVKNLIPFKRKGV